MIKLLSRDHEEAVLIRSVSAAVDHIIELAFPETDQEDRLGIEAEAFVIVEGSGSPVGRMRLPQVLDRVDEAAKTGSSLRPREEGGFRFETFSGGQITFEPGAQLEHSTAPARSASKLEDELELVWAQLDATFAAADARLVTLGVDPWHDTSSVPQQLPLPRYKTMDQFFASRWPSGATMMRNTCALQVNLDAGAGRVRAERWLAANLISPLLTAVFACSPAEGTKSRRATVWQSLDETRVGLPEWRSVADATPIGDCIQRALNANVMFILRDGWAMPGRPGWTFRDWIEAGHQQAGPPTLSDLETHLTTVFPEVRPRHGVLELRAPDGIPRCWWMVPLVVTGSVLYDEAARSAVIELLEPLAGDLRGAWRRAAAAGLEDPELAGLGRRVASLVVEAARRQPQRFDEDAVKATEDYLDRYTLRGLSPADEVALLLDDDSRALAWAAGEVG